MTNVVAIKDRIESCKNGRRYVYDIYMQGGGKWIVRPKRNNYPLVIAILKHWNKLLDS